MNQAPIITTQADFDEKLRSHKYLIIDFFATWCPPCRMLGSLIEELLATSAFGNQVKIFKLDVDQLTNIASTQGVRSLPTVVFYKDGVEVDRFVGFRPSEEFINLARKAFGPDADF